MLPGQDQAYLTLAGTGDKPAYFPFSESYSANQATSDMMAR